ncbi:MAG: DUF1573 domain-containing protein [Saprospiraceae bacterium]|nr:DUF1573 domain-containing protein [Saprospiraceae bacterium]
MKKSISTLLIAFLCGTFVIAQSADQVTEEIEQQAEKSMEKADPTSGPMMEFDSKVIDYGEIEKGSDPLRQFEFTNTGFAPLVIKNAKGSCGCTVPDYPKEPIMPGQTGTIDVRYDTKRIGQFSKTVTITSNMEEKIVLTIKGKVNNVVEEESVPTKEGSLF